MRYHYFLVDLVNNGEMYSVGVMSEDDTPIQCIMDYFKTYSKDVLYDRTEQEVDKKYAKRTRNIPCGKIFYTKFLFDKCIKSKYDFWGSELRRKLLKQQEGNSILE